MDQTTFMFLVFDWGCGSRNTKQDRASLSCSMTRERLFRGLSMWVTGQSLQPLVHLAASLPTYLPTYHSTTLIKISVYTRWPTVVLPLQPHVQPKSTSCLDMNFFSVLVTKLPFRFYLTFPLFLLLFWSVLCCRGHRPDYTGLTVFSS